MEKQSIVAEDFIGCVLDKEEGGGAAMDVGKHRRKKYQVKIGEVQEIRIHI